MGQDDFKSLIACAKAKDKMLTDLLALMTQLISDNNGLRTNLDSLRSASAQLLEEFRKVKNDLETNRQALGLMVVAQAGGVVGSNVGSALSTASAPSQPTVQAQPAIPNLQQVVLLQQLISAFSSLPRQ